MNRACRSCRSIHLCVCELHDKQSTWQQQQGHANLFVVKRRFTLFYDIIRSLQRMPFSENLTAFVIVRFFLRTVGRPRALHQLRVVCYQERPYHVDRATSSLLCEVKWHQTRVVLRWGTIVWKALLFLLFWTLEECPNPIISCDRDEKS